MHSGRKKRFNIFNCRFDFARILAALFVFILCFLANGLFAISIGDRVECVTSGLNIRVGPNTNYITNGVANSGDLGVVEGGPYYASGYTWYSNQWDSYSSGYSAAGSLQGVAWLESVVPNAPNLIYPGNSSSGSIIQTVVPTMTWSASTGATSYNLYTEDLTTGAIVIYGIGNTTSFTIPTGALTSGHEYAWYMTAGDSAGSSSTASSGILYFTPEIPPNVSTLTASSITSTSAVFNGSFSPNGVNAYAYFQYGTTTQYGIPWGETSVTSNLNNQYPFSTGNSSLLPATTYHYQLVVENSDGTFHGNDSSFTTLTSVLTAPSNFAISNAANGILLSWQNNSSNESGFLIQKSGVTTNYFSVGANQTNFLDTDVSPLNSYCYTATATNSSESSTPTPEQCTTYITPGSPPLAIIVGNATPVPGWCTFYGYYSTGTGLKYLWTTDNGSALTATNPQFVFSSGKHWVSLTVTDSSYRSSTASITVNVQLSNAGISSTGVSIGADPVVLATGNYIQNHVDLQMPSKGFPFQFSRFYNSKFSDQTGLPLGFGWTCNYNEKVQNAGTNVVMLQSDGSAWTFFPTNGGYVGEPGVFDTLVTNLDGTWTLTDKSQTATMFNTNGQLVSIIDKNGNSLTCTYVADVLNQITDTAGRIISFTTNSYGCIASMTDPLGRIVQYQYDSQTNLVAVIDSDLHTNLYNYNANHQMTNAIDGNGVCYIQNVYDPTHFTVTAQADAYTNWTYFGYDFTNNITYDTNVFGKVAIHQFDQNLLETNIIDENGNQESFAYDANRNRTLIQDKNGNQTRYAYDGFGNVTNKIDALNDITKIQYNALNNPICRIDALTNSTTFGYDARGNLTSTTNALNFKTTAQYDAYGMPIVLTDARGYSTTNQYDAQGDLTNVIDATGAATCNIYDGVGRKIAQVDALNHAISYAYDNDDNLLSTVNALGFTNSFTYDTDNNRTSSSDPRGATVTNIFDLKDRLIAVLAPLNRTNGTVYDPLDRKVATFDALGNQTAYAYDNIGNAIAVTNALNQATQFFYDPNGNQTNVVDPNGHGVASIFDALNRNVAAINTSVATNLTAYDALGRVITTTNADNQVTQFFYDGIGRLTNVVDAAGKSVFFVYDADGNRIYTTDPKGNTWTNVFDSLNRLVEKDDPLGHRTLLYYDAVGNVTNKITPNGDSIVYSYDAANELTNITYPSGAPVTFAFDSTGNRTNMMDGLGTTAWQFDLLNRLTSMTDPYGQTVANGYDPNGNRVSLTYPGNTTVNYGFDALNRMTTLTNWFNGVVSYSYDNRGNLITAVNANGTTANYGYDPANRLVTLTNAAPNANLIAAYSLTLDGVGNRLQAVNTQPLSPILLNQTNNYVYDSDNRLLSVDNQAVTHNPNGDLTSIGTNTFTYDFEDRLTQFVVTNVSGACGYDGLGNRLAREVNGQAEHFVVGRTETLTQVLAETDTNGSPLAYYVYGLGLAERITADGTVATYQYDIQGSTVALTDSGGNLTDSYAYDSFGVLANLNEVFPQPFHYLGQYGIVDDGAGLLYARARYWTPRLGRFLTKDTVTGKDTDSQSFNAYVYALNNPLAFNDVSGLCPDYPNHFWQDFGSALIENTGNAVFGVSIALEAIDFYIPVVDVAVPALGAGFRSLTGTLGGSLDDVGNAAAEESVLQNANYAQRTFSSTFSSGGTFAGQTVEDVAAQLRAGTLTPADVFIQYIVLDGKTLMLNTRSAQALEQAGIPRAQWNAIDMTGDAAAQARLAAQLQRNGLTSQGIPTVTPNH